MKNVYIYCEGQTEEAFVNNVLRPYFANMEIWVYPIVCSLSGLEPTSPSAIHLCVFRRGSP